MKQKIIICSGLPASGKTTWANSYVAVDPQNRVNVNRDDLRGMIGNGFHKFNENFITKIQHQIISSALLEGKSVVISDTNVHGRGENGVRQLVKNMGVNVEIEVMTFDTPLQECIIRDRIREAKGERFVGEKVIRRMYQDYFRDAIYEKNKPQNPYDPSLRSCVLTDIDGTMAIMKDRKPYEWSKVGNDEVNESVRDVVDALEQSGHKIIFMSGRDEVCRKETEEWLNRFVEFPYELYMRKQGDNRKDSIVKKELYEEYVKNKYNVLVVLDDRDSVVQLWRSLGLPTHQVNYGDF